jgi:hypothetical protein
MAVKSPKQAVETITAPESVAQCAAPNFADLDLESAIADQLLDEIDWAKVRAAMFTKVKDRFISWLTSGSDRPVVISPFPELSALPSSDDERAA